MVILSQCDLNVHVFVAYSSSEIFLDNSTLYHHEINHMEPDLLYQGYLMIADSWKIVTSNGNTTTTVLDNDIKGDGYVATL